MCSEHLHQPTSQAPCQVLLARERSILNIQSTVSTECYCFCTVVELKLQFGLSFSQGCLYRISQYKSYFESQSLVKVFFCLSQTQMGHAYEYVKLSVSKHQEGKRPLSTLGKEHVEQTWARHALPLSLPGSSSEFYFTHIWPFIIIIFFFWIRLLSMVLVSPVKIKDFSHFKNGQICLLLLMFIFVLSANDFRKIVNTIIFLLCGGKSALR